MRHLRHFGRANGQAIGTTIAEAIFDIEVVLNELLGVLVPLGLDPGAL